MAKNLTIDDGWPWELHPKYLYPAGRASIQSAISPASRVFWNPKPLSRLAVFSETENHFPGWPCFLKPKTTFPAGRVFWNPKPLSRLAVRPSTAINFSVAVTWTDAFYSGRRRDMMLKLSTNKTSTNEFKLWVNLFSCCLRCDCGLRAPLRSQALMFYVP